MFIKREYNKYVIKDRKVYIQVYTYPSVFTDTGGLVHMTEVNLSIDEWLKPKGDLPPFVRTTDKGKEGLITGVKLIETQFGLKLAVNIELDEVKTLILSKTFSLPYFQSLGKDLEKWKNVRVKITTIMVNIPKKGIVERPLMEITGGVPNKTPFSIKPEATQSPRVEEVQL